MRTPWGSPPECEGHPADSLRSVSVWRILRTVRQERRERESRDKEDYATQDHVGSSSAVTNSSGALVVAESFGAYGVRRGSSWTGSPTTGDWSAIAQTTRHGFTDHVMLDNLNVIHMNGRVFDGVIGRFSSADVEVDWGNHTQGGNRYSYVFDQPLSVVDPTGFGGVTCNAKGEDCVVGVDASRLPPEPFDLPSGDSLAEANRTQQYPDWTKATNSKPMLHPGDGGGGGDSTPQDNQQCSAPGSSSAAAAAAGAIASEGAEASAGLLARLLGIFGMVLSLGGSTPQPNIPIYRSVAP